MTTTYKLPSHPSLISNDPLGLCDNESPTFWDIIAVSVKKSKATLRLMELPRLIDGLVYSLHGDGKIDLGFLQNWLAEFELSVGRSLTEDIMRNMLTSALSLPSLFPSHEFTHLGPNAPLMELSLAQIRVLLAHQVLCTLVPPRGNSWGCTFRCWYSNPQPMEHAVRGYLETTFRFFVDLSQEQLARATVYQYFCSLPFTREQSLSQWLSCSARIFQPLEIERVTVNTVPFPHPGINCMLVSSHKEPGFGSSCTQEELITAACPQLLPLGALFVQPPISDHAVLVARDIYPASSWSGQGRNCRLQHFIDTPITPHTFLFLDALELDSPEVTTLSSIPDLIPENLLRELEKAYIGFRALCQLGVDRIASPLWGSGAFGGDPVVKGLVLSMAAARADIFVTLMIDEERSILDEHSVKVLDILEHMKTSFQEVRVNDVLEALCSAPGSCDRWLDYLLSRLGKKM